MLFSKATFMVLTIAASANGQNLGTAAAYGVLAGSTITNTGLTVINARIGLSPGSSITGFGPGVSNGQDINNGAAITAKADAESAYNVLVGLPSTRDLTGTDLGGLTLGPGVYTYSSSGGLTGALTLDAQGNSNALFVFQFGSTITTASNSVVNLINGAQGCNIFWQVGSSATFGTDTTFLGNVLARTSITVTTRTSLRRGGFYALDGAVTLDTNAIDQGGACGVAPPGSSTTTSTTSVVTIPTDTVTLPSDTVTLPTITLPISLPTITLPTITLTSPTNTITSNTDIVTSTTTRTVTNPASTTTITISVPITVTQTISASTTKTTCTTTKWSTKPWTKTASATKCPTKVTSTKKSSKTSTKAQNYKRARSTKTKTVTTTCAGYTKTQKGSQATHTVKATRAFTSTIWQTKQATTTSTFTQYPACTNNPKAKRDYERMFG